MVDAVYELYISFVSTHEQQELEESVTCGPSKTGRKHAQYIISFVALLCFNMANNLHNIRMYVHNYYSILMSFIEQTRLFDPYVLIYKVAQYWFTIAYNNCETISKDKG